jgi:hypothetical protein
MADEEMVKVRYEGNADRFDQTGAITLSNRDPVELGGIGSMTLAEIARLRGRGILLVPIGEADMKNPLSHNHDGVPDEHPLDFSSMSGPDLQTLIDRHGLSVTGTGSGGSVVKNDLISALEAAH